MDDIVSFFQNNWHKILVVLLVLSQAWKYFYEYIRPAVIHEKQPQPINIVLPPEGCTITIKPIEVKHDHTS